MFFSLRFGIENLVRNKGRSLAALAGGLLAITLIAGANISVDVATNKILLIALNETPVDFIVIHGDLEGVPGITGKLEKLEGIEVAEPVVKASVNVMLKPSEYESSSNWASILGVDPSFDRISEKIGFAKEVEFDLKDNEMLITEDFLSWLCSSGTDFQVGDNVTLYLGPEYWDSKELQWDPFTFKIKGIVNPWGMFYSEIVISRDRAINIVQMYGGMEYVEGITAARWDRSVDIEPMVMYRGGSMCLVLIDRDQVITPADLEGTKRNLEFIRADIELALSGEEIYVQTPIVNSIDRFSSQLESARVLFLVASVPVIALGIYLAMIGTDVGFSRRRSEIALLKSRGASNRQITNLLLTEATILGIVAGVIGLLLGALVTSMVIVPLPVGQSLGTSNITQIGISSTTIIICIFLGVVIMGIASIRPVKRINKIRIIEALGKYSAAYEKEEYKRTVDIILVLFPTAIYSVLLVIQGDLWGGPNLLMFVLFIFMAVGALLLPFTPFMLILGLTGLLTRGTTKTYELVSRIFKPVVGSLYPLIARNLSRNPRRTSRVAVLIALSLAFGTFIMVFSSSEEKQQESRIIFTVGSDIKITDAWSLHPDNLTKIIGVDEVCGIMQDWADSRVGGIEVYAFDPEKYARCVEDNKYMTDNLRKLLGELALEKRGALVFSSKKVDRWEKGEDIVLPLHSSGITKQMNLTILGFFGYGPGLDSTLYENAYSDTSVVIIRDDYLEEQIPERSMQGYPTILVKKRKDTDSTALMKKILSDNPDLSEWSVQSVESKLKTLYEDPMILAGFSFMHLEFGFTLIMATFGLGLIMFMAATERESEVAGMIARGLSKGQVMKVLTGEAFSIVLIAFLIGVPVGTLIVLILRTVMNQSMGLTIPLPFVFPSILLLLLGLTAVSLTVASFLSAVKVSRINLSEALRIR